MTDRKAIIKEIERRMDILYPQLPDASKVIHENISIEQAGDTGKYVALESLLTFINSLPEEPVSEGIEEAADEYATGYNLSGLYKITEAFKAGANWQKQQDKSTIELAEDHAMLAGMEKMKEQMMKNLWKPADGDDLPEYEREVIVFTQNYPDDAKMLRVAIGHRPNPDGWDGKSLLTGKVEHYTPETYDKGGWNIPDVKYWLDCELPIKEEE